MRAAPPPIGFAEALRVWAKIGCLSFGGPAAQIALMHRVLVDEKRWIGEARFLHALNFCMLLPGPEAQQLATYAGWLMHGLRGGLAAGILFVLPGALVMLGLAAVFAAYGDVSFVRAVFYGIAAAVLAIVVEALLRIGRRALAGREAYLLAGLAFVAIFFFATPFPLVVLTALVWGIVRGARKPAGDDGVNALLQDGLVDRMIAADALPHIRPTLARQAAVTLACFAAWLVPVVLLAVALGPTNVFAELARFFSVMATVTFGGAYAVLAYVAQQAVENHGWLSAPEMIQGLALAETTPGPLILVTQFVGFLAGFREGGGVPLIDGTLGAAVTLWVTFAPSFLWIFSGAPYAEALRTHRRLRAGLAAVTAAVVGVILNLAVWFALHVFFGRVDDQTWFGILRLPVPDATTLDPVAVALAAISCVVLFGLRLGLLATIAIAAALGLAVKLAL